MNKSTNSLANSGNIPNPTSTSAPSSPSGELQKVKMVLLGDAQVGKTSLAMAYTTRTFPQHSQIKNKLKAPFADYYTTATVDDKEFELSVWDTNASPEYEHIRPLNFAKTDIFLLCFSVMSSTSLENVLTKWSREIKNSFPAGKEPPKLLVGLRTDMRCEPLPYDKEKKATRERALDIVKEIGALDYVECSARNGDGLEDVFLAALNAVIYPCLQPSDNINLRGSGGANVEDDSKDIVTIQPNNGGNGRGKKKRCIIS